RPVVVVRSLGSAMLICSAYDFYPKGIKVSWLRDGEPLTSEVTSTEELADGDWYYQIHSHLEHTPKSGEKISCVVEHASFQKPIVCDWEPSLPETERSKLALGAVGLMLGVITAAAGLTYYRCKQSAHSFVQQGGHMTSPMLIHHRYRLSLGLAGRRGHVGISSLLEDELVLKKKQSTCTGNQGRYVQAFVCMCWFQRAVLTAQGTRMLFSLHVDCLSLTTTAAVLALQRRWPFSQGGGRTRQALCASEAVWTTARHCSQLSWLSERPPVPHSVPGPCAPPSTMAVAGCILGQWSDWFSDMDHTFPALYGCMNAMML
ncbi:hypothetical protein P4O66_017517, partial [Electrophorus voltai]